MKKLFFLVACLMSFQLLAQQEHPFAGKWCGKWDDTYRICFTIPDDLLQPVSYQWQEKLNMPMRSNSIVAKQSNANTLVLDNKIIVFDMLTGDKALAIGMFDSMSRVANLNRQDPKQSNEDN